MAILPQTKPDSPGTPPPPYDSAAAGLGGPMADSDQPYFAPLSSPPHPPNSLYPATPAAGPTHPLFGPTPISQQQGLLIPYYDPRSPYAIEQAGSRTRWRFIGALFWSVGILAVIVVLTGAQVWTGGRRWN